MFGQLHGHGFASLQGDTIGVELFLLPVGLGELVVGQHRNPLLPQIVEKLRAVTFPVKHQGEPVAAGIFGQALLLFRRLGHVGLQPGNYILFEGGDQPRVHLLVHVQKGLAIHGIDPVIGGGPQAQALARHVMAR